VDEPLSLLETVKAWHREASAHSFDWRRDAQEDYDFVAGQQWTPADRALLAEQMRPVITFNRIGPVVDAVAGSEAQNRQELRFVPREVGDSGVNELLTGAARWFRDRCDAEDEESDAFFDLVVSGMGWTETRLDYEEETDGKLIIERVDPLEMFWDAGARKRNLVDARYVMRVREIEREAARSLWPEAAEEDLNAGWAETTPGASSPHDATLAPFYRAGARQAAPCAKVRVVHLQWWEREIYYRALDPVTGAAVDLSVEAHARESERARSEGWTLRALRQARKRYRYAFVGNTVLDQGDLAQGFTFKAITGKRDRNANTWFGLVRAMKDPQRWANKWLSQALHIMNSNAKGGLLAERDAFDNPRAAEESWSDPAAITWLRPGGLAKIEAKPPANYPAGLDRLMDFAIASIRDVTGVNVEFLGLADREQAGVLEYQRRQTGMTVLANLFDSLRRYRKEQGRLLLWYVRNFLSDGRLIRIVGPEGARFVPLLRDPGMGEYDVVVDEAPSSPNQKERVWGALIQMMPVLVQAPVPVDVWAELVKYSPLPESLTHKIAASLMRPNPQAQRLHNLSAIQAEAQAGKTAADALLSMAKARAEAAKPGIEAVKALIASLA
jgi:hypothetical protein